MEKKINRKILFFAICFLFSFICHIRAEERNALGFSSINRGVWVSVFSAKKVLYSKEAILALIDLCRQTGLDEIYLQVYQSGSAYYDSKACDRSKYEEILKKAGTDTIDFLLEEAKKNNIKVFAWVNLLSLGQNENAHILKKFGEGVLTRDQYLRPSGRKNPNESDRYYLREEQLFLEPGDQRVAKYLISIIEEIIERYHFSGVHLDYARYPMTVPFIPGSRFTKFGLSYGYGRENIERFQDWTGLEPLSGLKGNGDYSQWDDWRRQQINSLVRRISRRIKEKSLDLLVSCAAVAAAERAYSSLFQDWPYWLEEKLVDYVVLMNYTQDNQLSKEIVRSALGYRNPGKVFIGMGVYLLKDNPAVFIEQYKTVKGLNPDGILFFSYDDITDEIAQYLSQH